MVTTPRLVGALDLSAVRRAERPTVGGYLRSLDLWIGPTDVQVPFLVVGEPGDAVADAVHAVRATQTAA